MNKYTPLAIAFILSQLTPVSAQKALTTDELIGSLQNSASTEKSAAAQKPLDVEALKNSLRNGLTVENVADEGLSTASIRPNVEVSKALSNRPAVNIQIFFDYDSASIKQDSIKDLMNLGNALSSPSLSGSKFLIGGHTDGKGSRQYNMVLSQRRAESVQKFLEAAYPATAGRLVPLGFGMEQLQNPSVPEDPSNRRVQVLNIGN